MRQRSARRVLAVILALVLGLAAAPLGETVSQLAALAGPAPVQVADPHGTGGGGG
ncbi:MAG: hypothetical protein OHK0015_29100 [Chloroflexi bacterium OHK40]